MLRLLCHWMLALCLMLTGIGSAAASASMHAAVPAPDVPAQVADCDHAAAADADIAETTRITPAQPHDGCGGDCCDEAAGCRCTCMQLAQFLDFPVAALAQVLPRVEAGAIPPCAHPAPLAGEDIRPPIRRA